MSDLCENRKCLDCCKQEKDFVLIEKFGAGKFFFCRKSSLRIVFKDTHGKNIKKSTLLVLPDTK